MKVKIIEEREFWDLEKRVNEILSKYKPSDIFDIKYSGSGNHSPHSVDQYSVMIIFNDQE